MTDHDAVCAVITAIMGHEAFVLPNYGGGWDGERYVGFAAQVDDHFAQVCRIVPGKTKLEAACGLLAKVRAAYPDKAALASGQDECAEGMAIYAAYVEAKTDAIMAESAARLADIRSLSQPVPSPYAVAAE